MGHFLPGDLLVGGNHGYSTLYRPDTSVEPMVAPLIIHIPAVDDEDNLLRVNGITFSPDGEMFRALGDPLGITDNDPHDIAYIRGTTPGLAIVVARSNDTAEIRKYDTDLNLISTHVIATDTGWTRDKYMKLKVDCSGSTAYYTDGMRTIFRWNLNTNTQMTHFAQLPVESPYVYAAFDLVPNTPTGVLAVDMSAGGNGPRNGIARSEDGIWTDEINPTDDSYEIFLRSIEDGSDIFSLTVSLDPEDTNDEVTALAVWFEMCLFPGVARYARATTDRTWFTRT